MALDKVKSFLLTLCAITVVFNAAFAVVPLILAPMSDYIGRNPVCKSTRTDLLRAKLTTSPADLISYAGFTLWFIGLALGKNIWSMIIFRFFSGCFGAAGTTMVSGGRKRVAGPYADSASQTGGTLSDMWDTNERSVPMAIFSFTAVMGTILAPVYCGKVPFGGLLS